MQQRDFSIAKLATQLPRQRRQLAVQAKAVTQAANNSLNSSSALVLAAGAGGLLGWCWFQRYNHSTDNSGTTASAAAPAAHNAASAAGTLLRQGLSAALMAYLARSLA